MKLEEILEKVGEGVRGVGKGLAVLGTAGIIYACATTKEVIYPVYGQGPVIEQTYESKDFKFEGHFGPEGYEINEELTTKTGAKKKINIKWFPSDCRTCHRGPVHKSVPPQYQPPQYTPQPQPKPEPKPEPVKPKSGDPLDP